jgi:hypothetical protein
MLCILHEAGRPIGTSREQLYEEFVAFILSHYEEKMKFTEHKTKKKHILNKYYNVLLKFGRLAYKYNQNEMELSFSMDAILTVVGEDAMSYGFMYRSHPVSRYNYSEVGFLHKTLQEYLASYFIKHQDMDSFKQKCRNIDFVKAELSLIRFLVHQHLTPDEAHQFVKHLTEYNPTEDLLEYLLQIDLLQGYPHITEYEPVTFRQDDHHYMYKFPKMAFKVRHKKQTFIDRVRHKNRKFIDDCFIELNKINNKPSQSVKPSQQVLNINLPQIQDVHEVRVRGDGEFIDIDYDILLSCHLYCLPMNLLVDAHHLQKLFMYKINPLVGLELRQPQQNLKVKMWDRNLHGCMSVLDHPRITRIHTLDMDDCSLSDSDLAHSVSIFKSQQGKQEQQSTKQQQQKQQSTKQKQQEGKYNIDKILPDLIFIYYF